MPARESSVCAGGGHGVLGTFRCVLGVSYSLYITIPAASVVHELLLCCASSFLFEEQRYSLLSWGRHDHTHSHVSHQADGCLFCTCQCLVPHSSLKINTQISTEIVPPTPHTRTPPIPVPTSPNSPCP